MQNTQEILCGNILRLRKEAGLTQEALAQKLDLTFQAVSKWENGLSCPDIGTLPLLADIFGVSLDALFGRETSGAGNLPVIGGLPWDSDENVLHAVLYRGHQLVREVASTQELKTFSFVYEGAALNVYSSMDVTVRGTVSGSINANGDVDIDGDVLADTVIVHGDVECGSITARDGDLRVDIRGDVDCGSIVCDSDAVIHIAGDLDADSIACGPQSRLTVEGDVDVGAAVSCTIFSVKGDLHAEVVQQA